MLCEDRDLKEGSKEILKGLFQEREKQKEYQNMVRAVEE